jgi:hypothetical protein
MANGKPTPKKLKRLTKEELADTSRYRLYEEELELPELDGTVLVRTLSVGKRRELKPIFVDGKPTKEGMAAQLAALVVDPVLTQEEAEAIIDRFPTTAYDKVQNKFAELLGTEEERRDTVQEFRPAADGS